VKARIESLRVVRFVAASLVIALHSWQAADGDVAPRPLAAPGPMGVDPFFVLSGYIMATVAARSTAGEFLARRAIRVLAPAAPETLVLMVLCWGVALVVYRGVEQPLLQRLRRPRAAPAAAAAGG